VILFTVVLFAFASAANKRTLVLLDNWTIRETHSIFFKTLRGKRDVNQTCADCGRVSPRIQIRMIFCGRGRTRILFRDEICGRGLTRILFYDECIFS